MLQSLDYFFAITGCLMIAGWGVWRATTKRPDISQFIPVAAFREDAVLLAMLAYLVAAMVLSSVMRATGRSPDEVLTAIVVNNGAQVLGIAACLVLAARRLPGGVQRFFGGYSEIPTRADYLWAFTLGGMVAAIGVCPLIRDLTAWLILQIAPDYQFESHPTLEALHDNGLPAARAVALWVGAAVIAPVAEEFFFRGVLQNFLAATTRRCGLAIMLTSLGFAAVHFTQLHALPALFFLGLLLGFLYAKTGKLIIPVLIHSAFNLKTLIWESLA